MKKKLRMKKSLKLAITLLILGIGGFVAFNIYTSSRISEFIELGYSREASAAIIAKGVEEDFRAEKYNDTLNAVVTYPEYEHDKFKVYRDIVFSDVDDLANNINLLNEMGYDNTEVSYIIGAGSDEDIESFMELGKQRKVRDFLEYDFSLLNNYQKYVDYQLATRDRDFDVVIRVNLGFDKEFYEDPNIIEEFSITMLVNKYNQISIDLEPTDLIKIDEDFVRIKGGEYVLNKEAALAFEDMARAAKEEDMLIVASLAYRSYEEQEEIFNEYVTLYGEDAALKAVAKPGFSEHQSGLAVDVASANGYSFKDTLEFTWMLDNAYKYGFIYRYPISGVDVTGYSNEPGHYRYVGVELATDIYESGLTFDEYYAVYLDN